MTGARFSLDATFVHQLFSAAAERTAVALPLRRTPSSTLFPYTTLFRSSPTDRAEAQWPEAAYVLVSLRGESPEDRKSTRLNSSHRTISYAVFCSTKKTPPPARSHADGLARPPSRHTQPPTQGGTTRMAI